MSSKINKKIFSIIIALLILIINTVPSFAHHAVFFDFLIGPDFSYQISVKDDAQGTTEAAHYEFASGYFLDAGTGKNRPLFIHDIDGKEEQETSNSKVKVNRRGPGYIYDESASEERVKYYENYSQYKNTSNSKTGLCELGKRFTFPPMNATRQGSKKVLHMDTTSEQIKEISWKSERMISGFNALLDAVGTQDENVYTSTDTDFLAVAEILADAIAHLDNGEVHVPIPINDTEYHSVTLKKDAKEGRKYNATVVRADGKTYKIMGAIRTVDTGFKAVKEGNTSKKGQFILTEDGEDINYIYSNEVDGTWSTISTGISTLSSWVTRSNAPPKQDFYFRSEMTLVNAVVAANKKYVVDGRDSISGYIDRDESILSREISKFLISLFEGLESMLKLQDYDELIYNQGVRNPSTFVIQDNGSFTNTSGDEDSEAGVQETERYDYVKNDPYLLGVYRASWHSVTKAFYTVFLVLGLFVILFGLVKLLANVQTIAINPYYRGQTYQTILNYIIVALLMPSVWIIFYTLLSINYYLVDIFGAAVNYQSIQSMAITGASGTIATLVLSGFYFVILVYFNVVYVLRSVNIAVLMGASPLILSTLTLGPKYKDIFDTWLKELTSNIFLQAFHAAILTFITSVQVHSSGVEKVVLLVSLVALTNVFRSMFLSSQTISTAEKQGDRGMVFGTAVAAGAVAAPFVAAGAVGGAMWHANGKKHDRTADGLGKENKAIDEEIRKNPNMSKEDLKAKKEKMEANEKKIKELQQKAQTSRKIGDMTKATLPAMGKTEGAIATTLPTGGMSLTQVGRQAERGLFGIAGVLEDKFKEGTGFGEFVLDKSDFGDNVDSINANKDSMTLEYNRKALSKEEHAKMAAIENNMNLTDEEKNKEFAKILGKNTGIDLQVTQGDKPGEFKDVKSQIKYDSSTGKLTVENQNTTGYDLTSFNGKVIAKKNRDANTSYDSNIMAPSERLNWMNGKSSSNNNNFDIDTAKEVATTASSYSKYDYKDFGSYENSSGNTVISNTPNTDINRQYSPIPELCNSSKVKQLSNGAYEYNLAGTNYSGTLIDAKQNGTKSTFTYQMTPQQQQHIQQIMSSEATDAKKAEVRDAYITNTFGTGAVLDKYTGNVKVTTHGDSSISNMAVVDNKLVVSTFDGNAPRAHTHASAKNIGAVENYVKDYNSKTDNPNKMIDTTQLHISPSTFGLNESIANFNNIQVSQNQGNNNVVIPVTTNVNESLNKFETEFRNNYTGDRNNKEAFTRDVNKAVSGYATANFGIKQKVSKDADGNYQINLGKSEYNNVVYHEDSNEIRLFKTTKPDNNSNGGQNQPPGGSGPENK